MLVEELLRRLNDTMTKAFPKSDRTRSITLTGSALTLPNESCKYVTFLNLSGSSVTLTVNGGDNFTLPNNAGGTIFVTNTNLITANGTVSTALQYILSE